MRPVDEQAILVTGATAGLGKEVARELAQRGATVLVHGRNAQRIEQTVAELAEDTGGQRLIPCQADLASLEQVRGLAEKVAGRGPLHGLVNNAGLAAPEPEKSADGYELTFAVNFLAPFLLTRLLLPAITDGAPARVVNVASIGQAPVNFEDPMQEHGYDRRFAYNQSKLALIAFTFELAERLAAQGEDGVTVNALHPATLMPTKLVLESYGRTVDSLEQGVEATLRLVIDPELDEVSGAYFNGLEPARADSQAYDPDARRRLWKLGEKLCGL